MTDFNDDNTLEDILGLLWSLDDEIMKASSERNRSDMYMELMSRIEDKINRNTIKERGNWFKIALEHVFESSRLWVQDRKSEAKRTRPLPRLPHAWTRASVCSIEGLLALHPARGP